MVAIKAALFALVLSVVSAAPVLEERQSATTCGSTYYSASKVSSAASAAYSNYRSGNTPGGYPHTYNNYEGFDFPVSGPYQEFPIKTSGIYTGGEYPIVSLLSLQ
jgi:uncharacterized membrane protein